MTNINFVQADLIWRKDWISRTPTKRFAGKPENGGGISDVSH
ncbi:hypothe [Burkholderia pseudomallei 305]|nr:hypothe [Burkholderia pseudomallei 305]